MLCLFIENDYCAALTFVNFSTVIFGTQTASPSDELRNINRFWWTSKLVKRSNKADHNHDDDGCQTIEAEINLNKYQTEQLVVPVCSVPLFDWAAKRINEWVVASKIPYKSDTIIRSSSLLHRELSKMSGNYEDDDNRMLIELFYEIDANSNSKIFRFWECFGSFLFAVQMNYPTKNCKTIWRREATPRLILQYGFLLFFYSYLLSKMFKPLEMDEEFWR